MKFIYRICLSFNSRPHQSMLMLCHQATQPFFDKIYATFYFIFLTMKPLKDPKIDKPFFVQRLLK
jgi:hypothetical protein